MKLHDVCTISDIPDRQARGFLVEAAEYKTDLFIVRRGVHFYCFLNRCPHTGTSLNWQPDQFLDSSKKLIQCATHGAQFRITDGYCVRGPCRGHFLTAISHKLENDRIKIQL